METDELTTSITVIEENTTETQLIAESGDSMEIQTTHLTFIIQLNKMCYLLQFSWSRQTIRIFEVCNRRD